MADKLTPQQHQAVYDRGGKLLVSAAAGSGKTKVLVDRLMTYLTDPNNPADLDSFLIITYTKAAAAELRGKIAAKLTEKIAEDPANRHLQKQIQRLFLTKISTVHGFCGDLLREYTYLMDLPADFRIADENECREIRAQVLNDLLDRAYQNQSKEADFQAFIDSQGLGRTDKLVPEIIEKVYDSARCHLNPEKWMDDCLQAAEVTGVSDVSETVWGRYLMEELFSYLDSQISSLEDCIRQADMWPELEKVGKNLSALVFQLKAIRSSETWDAIVENRTLDYGRLVFPRKNPAAELSDRIKAIRNACKKGLDKKFRSFSDPSAVILQDLQQAAAGVRGLADLVRQFEKDYSAAKKARRCLDFSDLEHKTLDLLLGASRSGPTSAAREIAERFLEIMVDEYQDSNAVQDAIFDTLTIKKQNCFMVGDVKQSIYQFRLADPGIFLEKYHSYVPAENAAPGQGRKVLLSHNFRSGCEIIDAVNDVFRLCMCPKVGGLKYGEEESLREGVPRQPLPDPAVELYAVDVQEETYPEEAAFVAGRIHAMLAQGMQVRDKDSLRPVQPDDIVILLRSPGSAAQYFQKALEARGIRCTTGSGNDLLDTAEISTLRSLLQTIQNPRQDIPLISILASPVFGFTADELGQIRSAQKKGCFYDALLLSGEEKVVHFLNMLMALRKEAQMQPLSVLLEQCFALTRLDSIYGSMPGGESKAGNLQAFYQLALDFEKGKVRDLAQFLDHLTALEEKGLASSAGSVSGCVTIMSIHKSKGLEFPVVFLSNLSRKFNQESLRAQILCDKDLGIGLSIADTRQRIRYPSLAKRAIASKMAAESLSEEMRVLYVALTRPKDRLIMTYASRSLASELQELALRQSGTDKDLLIQDASCPGAWVMQCALGKTEAGELHAISDRPMDTTLSAHPWKISVVQAPVIHSVSVQETVEQDTLPEDAASVLQNALSFVYPHSAATAAPSKQTATGRKGRSKDEEAAHNTQPPRHTYRAWRKPSFMEPQADSLAKGNAIHLAMQYLDYGNCTDAESVQKEISRLAKCGFLSPDQAALVDCERIAAFFRTEIGRKLQQGIPHIREFKFSILDSGKDYNAELEGETVLLQGVVDCALFEEDGITVLDFKTDRVTDETVRESAEKYRPQIEAYAHALSKIYEQKVKKKYLYYFRLNRLTEL